ncbi:hypothetical protein RD055328_10660 [Companilactobacillus sp. RD055328]|uniref:MucBP domain-containing protein n=1 Tax=Companilactobacillus sp. RD055328 TaxID=2916634 RepID=UPI001FC7DCD6|nr:MucBP domain-containing protein [Companilactobacillus sp. RD055328]GKQ43143.1 hypothetical protein RD055328_10660 [Companilactobacillus sp. RD055328]
MYKTRKELRKLANIQRRNNVAKKAVTTSALALGMGLGLTAIGSNKVDAATWTANSVESIQTALKTSGTTPYTIKWGDTLSTITEAANKNGIETSVQRLAEINKISNINLIYAGNKLWFSGQGSNGTVTVTDKDGNSHTYNLDPNKPLNNNGGSNSGSSNGSHNNGNANNNNSGNNNNGSNNGSDNNGNNNGSGSDNGSGETPTNPTDPTTEKVKYSIVFKNKETGKEIQSTTGEDEVGSTVEFTAKNEIIVDGKKYTLSDPSKTEYSIKLDKDATKNVIEVEYSEDTTAPIEKTSVTINAVDEDSKTIKTDTIDNLNVGDDYTAQAPTIDGYKLNDDSAKTITLAKDNNTITFKYIKDSTPVEKTSVTINSVDENGKTIKTDTVDNLNVGDEYTASAPTIDGYKLNDDATKKITLAKDGNTITFKFVKEEAPVEKTSYTVSYQDEAGNKLQDDKTVNDQVVGTTVKEDAPAIDGYTIKGDASQSLTLQATGNKIVFTYVKNDVPSQEATLIVKHVDTSGNELPDFPETTTKGKAGDSYSEIAKYVYGLQADSYQKSGKLVAGENVVTFTYTKSEQLVGAPVGTPGLLDVNGTYNGVKGSDILKNYNNGQDDWTDEYGNNWHKGYLLFDSMANANAFGDKYLTDNSLNFNSYSGYGVTGVYGQDHSEIAAYALEWKNFGPNKG